MLNQHLALQLQMGAALGDLTITCRALRSKHDVLLNDGGAYRDRTDDPLLAKQVLSQLS